MKILTNKHIIKAKKEIHENGVTKIPNFLNDTKEFKALGKKIHRIVSLKATKLGILPPEKDCNDINKWHNKITQVKQ